MFTLEKKVDLVMRYIATANKAQQRELKALIIEALNENVAAAPAPTPEPIAPDVEEMIVEFLKEVGARQSLVGYNYIISAIALALSDRAYFKQITARLYPDIAERYGATPSQVERAIRHSIEVVFRNGDWKELTDIFGNTISISKGKLTNSEFITCCVNEITRRMKKQGIAV